MTKRLSLCVVGVFAVVLIAQPALGEMWKLVGSSGNSGSSNPEDWTTYVVDNADENLYEVNVTTGSTTYIRGLKNNVDQILASEIGWVGPFWGEGYRDGQNIAYNPSNGLLYHRNGTTGYRDAPDPRHYDTRLIETYAPGAAADFLADPVEIANSLLTPFGPSLADPVGRINSAYPIDGNLWSESRDFTWNPLDENFIIANNNGNIGTLDPVTAVASFVRANAITHKGLAWYSDGSATGRLFSGENDSSPGDTFWELETGGANFLAPLDVPTSIAVIGGPAGGTVEQTIAMDQNPATGDLFSVVVLSTGGRHLIRYDAADVDSHDPSTALFINAQYLGPTVVQITALAHVPVAPHPGDADCDGWVTGLDYLIWAGNFGTHPGPDGDISDGDFNDDGWVNGLDYLLWAANYGTHSGGTAVPEPASGVLLLIGLAACATHRRCRAALG